MMEFDRVYEYMNGYSVKPGTKIRNEFEDGECAHLESEIYEARMRLSRRLEVDGDGEEADCMVIVHCYERMMYLLCERAFEYGKIFGCNYQKT